MSDEWYIRTGTRGGDEGTRVRARKTVYLDICEQGDTVILAIRNEHATVISSYVPAEVQLKEIREELVQTSLRGGLVFDIDCPSCNPQIETFAFFGHMISATRRSMPYRPINSRLCFREDVRVAFSCAQFRTIRVLNVMGLGQIAPQTDLPNRVPIFRTLDEAVKAVSRPQLRCISADDDSFGKSE
jgi:hypothetical protein